MKVDVRATNTIKICINKVLKNKDSVNLDIAKCVSSFSHATKITEGSVFTNSGRNFYVVNKILSPFWVQIVLFPPITFHVGTWGVVATPHWSRGSRFHKKKVFDPFGFPYLKKRGRVYHFKKPLYSK